MPIYEYYCRDNNTIYQFYAKTRAQGQTVPRCPQNPAFSLVKLLSPFAVAKKGALAGSEALGDKPGDTRLASSLAAMEGELARVDENDPRALGRLMRRMAELSGDKMDGTLEEVVRKLEEGADPEGLEDQLAPMDAADGPSDREPPARSLRPGPRGRARPRVRDPQLYDYE